ncbi:MAG: hypothetical protein AAFS10_25475, partial [Myxococcota bacterium]
ATLLGRGKAEVTFASTDDEAITVTVQSRGFVTRRVEVAPSHAPTLHIALVPKRRSGGHSPETQPPKPDPGGGNLIIP